MNFKIGQVYYLVGRKMVVASVSEWSVNLETSGSASYNFNQEEVKRLTQEGKLIKEGE